MRLTSPFLDAIRSDLAREHPFAAERIGFATVATSTAADGTTVLLGAEYHPLADEQYRRDPNVGARINADAIRFAMQLALDGASAQRGVFHLHMHDHQGTPGFSPTDAAEPPKLVRSFAAAAANCAHGMIVVSRDQLAAWIWLPKGSAPTVPIDTTVVEYPLRVIPTEKRLQEVVEDPERRFSRQSFLGPHSDGRIAAAKVGVVGIGGGGSHVVQQLAHLGFRHVTCFDADTVSESNLNRMVTATSADVAQHTAKIDVARRMIAGLSDPALSDFEKLRWQDAPNRLIDCDVVVGCVDTFAERAQLEAHCRRYLIPYIDIGMDVHMIAGERPRMGGQVILSLPGHECMRCMEFINEERLGQEAARYGDTGGRPQVVWPNGVLASTAVGLVVDLVTGWSGRRLSHVYLSYDGNTGELKPHVRLKYMTTNNCAHYPISEVGNPVYQSVEALIED